MSDTTRAPALAWPHDAPWPAAPGFGTGSLRYDLEFLMLTGDDPQEGWPLPLASVAPTAAFPGIEPPFLPQEVPVLPLKDTWDRTVERLHAAPGARREWNASGETSWLPIAIGGACGALAMCAVAVAVARTGR